MECHKNGKRRRRGGSKNQQLSSPYISSSCHNFIFALKTRTDVSIQSGHKPRFDTQKRNIISSTSFLDCVIDSAFLPFSSSSFPPEVLCCPGTNVSFVFFSSRARLTHFAFPLLFFIRDFFFTIFSHLKFQFSPFHLRAELLLFLSFFRFLAHGVGGDTQCLFLFPSDHKRQTTLPLLPLFLYFHNIFCSGKRGLCFCFVKLKLTNWKT